MGHTFDPEKADSLEDADRFRYLSRDEIVGALEAPTDGAVAEIGSGTGFYTREVAPFVGTLYAVDVQDAMHDQFRARSVPENVELVRAPAASLPFEDGELEGLYSTMTFHEVSSAAPAEFARVLTPGGTLVVADWSKNGTGERGPPLSERRTATGAVDALESAGFSAASARERPETLFVAARLD